MSSVQKVLDQTLKTKESLVFEGSESQRNDVVLDVYHENSIKDPERANRGADTGTQFGNLAPGHKIHQWRKLLCSPESKSNLTKFMVNE